MNHVGRNLAAELGPLFPIMRTGPPVECVYDHRPILPGHVYFLKDDDVDGDRPICARCGITIEMACGRMTYATARAIPRYGEPYPNHTDHVTAHGPTPNHPPPDPDGGHAPRTPLREDAADGHSP